MCREAWSVGQVVIVERRAWSAIDVIVVRFIVA
jgi:hypothetical protein